MRSKTNGLDLLVSNGILAQDFFGTRSVGLSRPAQAMVAHLGEINLLRHQCDEADSFGRRLFLNRMVITPSINTWLSCWVHFASSPSDKTPPRASTSLRIMAAASTMAVKEGSTSFQARVLSPQSGF